MVIIAKLQMALNEEIIQHRVELEVERNKNKWSEERLVSINRLQSLNACMLARLLFYLVESLFYFLQTKMVRKL